MTFTPAFLSPPLFEKLKGVYNLFVSSVIQNFNQGHTFKNRPRPRQNKQWIRHCEDLNFLQWKSKNLNVMPAFCLILSSID